MQQDCQELQIRSKTPAHVCIGLKRVKRIKNKKALHNLVLWPLDIPLRNTSRKAGKHNQ